MRACVSASAWSRSQSACFSARVARWGLLDAAPRRRAWKGAPGSATASAMARAARIVSGQRCASGVGETGGAHGRGKPRASGRPNRSTGGRRVPLSPFCRPGRSAEPGSLLQIADSDPKSPGASGMTVWAKCANLFPSSWPTRPALPTVIPAAAQRRAGTFASRLAGMRSPRLTSWDRSRIAYGVRDDIEGRRAGLCSIVMARSSPAMTAEQNEDESADLPSPLGEKVPEGRMRGDSPTSDRPAPVLYARSERSGRGSWQPHRIPLIRLPAPSPRGEKGGRRERIAILAARLPQRAASSCRFFSGSSATGGELLHLVLHLLEGPHLDLPHPLARHPELRRTAPPA